MKLTLIPPPTQTLTTADLEAGELFQTMDGRHICLLINKENCWYIWDFTENRPYAMGGKVEVIPLDGELRYWKK
jgi:hypothetical protein